MVARLESRHDSIMERRPKNASCCQGRVDPEVPAEEGEAGLIGLDPSQLLHMACMLIPPHPASACTRYISTIYGQGFDYFSTPLPFKFPPQHSLS